MAASTLTAFPGTRSLATPHTRLLLCAPQPRSRHNHPPSPPQSHMEARLAQVAGLTQKDKATAYQSILADLLARPDRTALAQDLHILVENVVHESTGLVIGRQVLSELVKALEGGVVPDVELRKQIVQDTLDIIQPRIVSYEEQVCPNSQSLALSS